MKTAYDELADIYDAFMGTDRRDVVFVRELIEQHHPEAKTVFELGCGTGEVLAELTDNYVVSGIDLSENMITHARKKVPQATLHCADIREFNMERKYDVILCIFDTINHILRFREWKNIFSNAKQHLNEGGIFIFDINTKQRLKHLVKSSKVTKQYEDKTFTLDVKRKWMHYVFVLEIGSETSLIEENSFSESRIQWQLQKHFSHIRRYETLTGDIDEQMSTSEDIPARVFYVCTNT